MRSIVWRRSPLVLLLLSTPLPGLAQAPTLAAQRAVLVDPAQGVRVLAWKSGNDPALQGSLAKLMTAYVTHWAVQEGYVHWTDKVPLSLRDTQQACTCMKFSIQFASKCQSPTLQSTTQPGETFELRELLHVSLNQSTGESTDAIAEYVARQVYGQKAPQTTADSERLMNFFVGLMNLRAKELGLAHSRWITVHGGDVCDFTNGCDPDCTPSHCTPSACAPGTTCAGAGTTVFDLAQLWHALAEAEPAFLALIGSRAFELDQADAAKTFYNTYGHGYTYYPGLDGDKNGGTGAKGSCPSSSGFPASCHMAQATRAGRPLIAAVLQSFTLDGSGNAQGAGITDLQALLRYGYSYVLAPDQRANSGKQAAEPIKDHALACNEGTCFSALRGNDDGLRLIAWNALLDQGALQKLATFAAASGPGHYAPVSALDAATFQGAVVVAMVVNGQVRLADWWLESAPGLVPVKLAFLGDSGAAGGAGSLVRLAALGDHLLLTAVRKPDGTVSLATWKLVVSKSSSFSLLATATAPGLPNLGATGELAIAGGDKPKEGFGLVPKLTAVGYQGVVMAATSSGVGALVSFTVDDKDGAITLQKSQPLAGAGRNVSLANNGPGKFGSTRTSGGSATGPLRLEVWDVAPDGTFVGTLDQSETLSSTAATAIAPLGPASTLSGILPAATLKASSNTVSPSNCKGGPPATRASQGSAVAFLTAAGASGGTAAQLAAWDAPKLYQETASAPLGDYRLADSGKEWGQAGQIRLVRLPGGDLDQDRHVTAHTRPDGTLDLIGWGIGRPIPDDPLCSTKKAKLAELKKQLAATLKAEAAASPFEQAALEAQVADLQASSAKLAEDIDRTCIPG